MANDGSQNATTMLPDTVPEDLGKPSLVEPSGSSLESSTVPDELAPLPAEVASVQVVSARPPPLAPTVQVAFWEPPPATATVPAEIGMPSPNLPIGLAKLSSASPGCNALPWDLARPAHKCFIATAIPPAPSRESTLALAEENECALRLASQTEPATLLVESASTIPVERAPEVQVVLAQTTRHPSSTIPSAEPAGRRTESVIVPPEIPNTQAVCACMPSSLGRCGSPRRSVAIAPGSPDARSQCRDSSAPLCEAIVQPPLGVCLAGVASAHKKEQGDIVQAPLEEATATLIVPSLVQGPVPSRVTPEIVGVPVVSLLSPARRPPKEQPVIAVPPSPSGCGKEAAEIGDVAEVRDATAGAAAQDGVAGLEVPVATKLPGPRLRRTSRHVVAGRRWGQLPPPRTPRRTRSSILPLGNSCLSDEVLCMSQPSLPLSDEEESDVVEARGQPACRRRKRAERAATPVDHRVCERSRERRVAVDPGGSSSSCRSWHLGSVGRPLEHLLFGESSPLAPLKVQCCESEVISTSQSRPLQHNNAKCLSSTSERMGPALPAQTNVFNKDPQPPAAQQTDVYRADVKRSIPEQAHDSDDWPALSVQARCQQQLLRYAADIKLPTAEQARKRALAEGDTPKLSYPFGSSPPNPVPAFENDPGRLRVAVEAQASTPPHASELRAVAHAHMVEGLPAISASPSAELAAADSLLALLRSGCVEPVSFVVPPPEAQPLTGACPEAPCSRSPSPAVAAPREPPIALDWANVAAPGLVTNGRLVTDKAHESLPKQPSHIGRATSVDTFSTGAAGAPTRNRLAMWFADRGGGGNFRWGRVDEADEALLNHALQAALSVPAIVARRGFTTTDDGFDTEASRLYATFCRALEKQHLSAEGLRCVPLERWVARRLPPELSDPCVSATRVIGGGDAILAGSVLRGAKRTVEDLLAASGPAVFKIGITCDPLKRWRGYEREGYAQLHLLYTSDQPVAVQMLEAALIDAFQGRAGCRNVAHGGEGPTGRDPPYFTYLALTPCGAGVGVSVGAAGPRRAKCARHD